jgi:hypothetical protein
MLDPVPCPTPNSEAFTHRCYLRQDFEGFISGENIDETLK